MVWTRLWQIDSPMDRYYQTRGRFEYWRVWITGDMVLCETNQVKGPRFPIYLSPKKLDELAATANALIICGKGILATDETPVTLGIRFSTIGLENTSENRNRYRELLYATDCSIKKYISGIIVHPEALNEQSSDGKSIIELIAVSSQVYQPIINDISIGKKLPI